MSKTEENSIDVVVHDARVSWSETDDVYVHTGQTAEREDGYVNIGSLAWDDGGDEVHNIERLKQFVGEWLGRRRASA